VKLSLTELGCGDRPLSVIGHSLGGAMGVLAAHELGLNFTLSRLYTYGQPRVANRQFAAAFTARLGSVPFLRVVEYGDAVPHLPTANMFGEGWTHFGHEAYYNATKLGAFTICSDPTDKRCSYKWNLVETLAHTCDHCSYLGMDPCHCGSRTPQCTEPKGRHAADEEVKHLMARLDSRAKALKVLVFGDSQGDVGPTYRVLQDQLDSHGVGGTVVNKAIGGTKACGWATDPDALAKAARNAFGDEGPDYVWYTAGGNDLAGDSAYHSCLAAAKTDADARECLVAGNGRLMTCTVALLEGLWKAFPEAKVGQYNYEVACVSTTECLEATSQFIGGAYCNGDIACIVTQLKFWQTIYVDALQAKYPQPKYTGMNILGAVQEASGVSGASRGYPALTGGAKCSWMVACVHPKYGTPTATAVGTAMWDLWLANATAVGAHSSSIGSGSVLVEAY